MKLHLLYVSIFFICFSTSCGEKISNPPEVTPDPTKPTQSGKNVVVFKVNGTYHIYQGKTTLFDGNGVYFSLVKNDTVMGMIIQASHTKYSDFLTLYVKASYPDLNTTYRITEYYPYRVSYYETGNSEFNADTLNSTIIFTRSDSSVLAGRFEFIGKKDSLTDIHLLEGWFDITR